MLKAERTELLAASPAAIWEVLADVVRYPAWNPLFSMLDPVERDPLGRVVRAACQHDASVVVLKTDLRFAYADDRSVTASGSGNDVKSMLGSFAVVAADGGAAVTHVLQVDLGFKLGLLLRGPVEERVRRSALDRAFAGLREHVAASA